jgi:hypothetical protein
MTARLMGKVRLGARLLAVWPLAAWPLFVLVLSTAAPARGEVYMSRDQALAQVFGDSATVARRTVFLTAEQAAAISERARASIEVLRVTFFEGRDARDELIGHAYVDTHPVRTMAETILVVVEPDGTVQRVDVLAFHEPEDYRAPERWLDLLAGEGLSSPLSPGRDLPNLAGATLTARALATAVRRVLATHEELHRPPGEVVDLSTAE